MGISAFLYLSGAILMLLMANYIFYNDRQNPASRTFIYLSLIVSCLAGFKFLSVIHEGAIWGKLDFIWPSVIILLVHFILRYTGKKSMLKNPFVIVLLFLPGIVVMAFEFYNNLIMALTPGVFSGVKLFATLWAAASTAVFIAVASVYTADLKDKRKKRQVLFILAAS